MKPRHASILCLALMALAGCDTSGEDVRIVGQLESDRIEIRSEVFEPIIGFAVQEGQRVTAGQLLFEQDDTRILARIQEAAAALAQTKARLDELLRGPRKEQIAAARANVDGAGRDLQFRRSEYERARQVFERELASPDTLDRARAALDAAQANLDFQQARLEELLSGTTVEELEQAEQAVRQAEARAASLRIDLDRHRPRAPADGIVDSRIFEPGEQPAVGQPVLVMLAGTQPYARVYVPESMRVQVRSGTRARIHVDGLGGMIDGVVRWVASEAAFTPYFALTEHDRGRLSYLAKVDLLGTRDRLPDGMPVEVELVLDTVRH